MPSYYNRVFNNLEPGKIADVRDINLIQTNIDDAIKSVINDHHDHTAFILGEKEDAFKLTPAPKRLGRYIDTMNLVETDNEEWLPIRKYGYRQAIKKSKSSLYSIICKFRNLSNKPVDVWCELQSSDKITLKKSVIQIPAKTNSSEFEIIFDQEFCSTAPGLSHTDIEPFDTKNMAPPEKEESFEEGVDHTDEEDIKNFTIGASELFLVIKPLLIDETDLAVNGDESEVITDDTFCVLADKTGSYGKLLEQTGGIDYTETEYDLYFKDIYATRSTYLCETGEAVIDGQKVKCMDTHVSIDGANDFGHIDTFVYMDLDGHLRAQNSPAYLDENADMVKTQLPGAILPIAIITTYMNDVRSPKILQDDTSLFVRPRSHHERLRRLEKQMKYVSDVSIPPRLKYTLSGEDIVDTHPEAEVEGIDDGKYYTTTDAQGNFVIKTINAEVITIPVTLQGETEVKDSTGIDIAKRIAENTNMEIDSTKGTLKLKTESKNTSASVGMTDEEAKATELNPWDDNADNRPSNSDVTPTEREYSVTKGKNGKNDWSSEFPAMTFYTKEDFSLESFNIPITKFKNCESIKFIIWKRQGPNNKTNTVWLEKKIYTSESFSLENAKSKDDYQIMEDGFTIKVDGGLKLSKGQYIIMCIHTPKEGTGSCYVETYKPSNPKDFCIRYYGAADASHFLLKERYMEIWYNSATFKGTKQSYAKEGSIVSGTVTWDNEQPINTITASANITTPENCSYQLLADTGGGYQELKLDEATTMTGGGISFKWKLVFKGDTDTPVLEYNDEKKYAIQFTLTRQPSNVGSYSDYNECITTKTIKAEDVLKEYIGDPNFNLNDNRFSNYEFARIWASEVSSNRLVIDLAASDRKETIKMPEIQTASSTIPAQTVTTDIFSLIYADLSLDDFDVESVDYSNYDPQVEYDEHNMRLKLDTDNSYNDNDIALFDIKNAIFIENDTPTVSEGEDGTTVSFSEGMSLPENKTIFKIQQKNNSLDLSKHSGIKIGMKINGSVSENEDNTAIRGLGLYISSGFEDTTPSNLNKEFESDVVLAGVNTLPDLNKSNEEIINKYYGKIIQMEQTINGVTYVVFFKYYKDANGQYQLQQIHDLEPYAIYELPDLKIDNDNQQYVEIMIDDNSLNLSSVKEIGLITLSDENKFNVVKTCSVTFTKVRSIEKDYYPVYNPETSGALLPVDETLIGTGGNNHYQITLQTAKNSKQKRCRCDVYYNRVNNDGEVLFYHPNDTSTNSFNHIGLQLAANCWIPKNALKLNLCSDDKGRQAVYSINIPTLNTIHDPIASTATTGQDDGDVNFTQIFKKIKDDVSIKSISISTTEKFKKYMKEIRSTDTSGYISLYVGKVVFYKAQTIPVFHPNMRFKIYNENQENNAVRSSIRKIGGVLCYK